MVYAYIRVSTVKQNFEGQQFSILKYAEYRGLKVDVWVEEKVSGKVPREKRDLGVLVSTLKEGDVLLTSELSRLGRTITDTLITIDLLAKKKVELHLIKENQVSGTKEFSMLCAVYAIIAETERVRNSERSKEVLAAKKAAGMKFGHPVGYKCKNVKLTPYSKEILELLRAGSSIWAISLKYHVKWQTARDFIRDRLHYNIEEIPSVKKFRAQVSKQKDQ